ncbi:MAG: hypothetical protein IMF05_00360 [Proteobacteria bacterium]|nr:hypothetical protein [Pseudomonadota bacterium]
MRPTDARTAISQWRLRLARAARWALLGALSFLLGWAIVDHLEFLDIRVPIGGSFSFYGVNLGILVAGLAYTGALGVAIWRTRLADWRRAAGFAILAMPWFTFGLNASMAAFDICWDCTFLIWFGGLVTAGAWATLAGVLLLPFLRSWLSVAWLFAASVAFGALAGGWAGADSGRLSDSTVLYVVTAWCAVYAAAFSMTLPAARPHSGAVRNWQAE